jgi:predicted nuclease of predicted toxin-antitoxin system
MSAVRPSIGLANAADEELLKVAQQQRRILVTRDRDFGGLIFVRRLGAGVLYLRILPTTVQAVHAALQQVLASHTDQDLQTSFVVVEPGSYRIRRLQIP